MPNFTKPKIGYETNFWGEWPSGLGRCSKNRKVSGSNPTRRSAGLRDPTSLRGSRWPPGRKCKTQWLTSGEWGCPLDNGPKLAVGQPNSSLKKRKKKDISELKDLPKIIIQIAITCPRHNIGKVHVSYRRPELPLICFYRSLKYSQ